MWIKELELESNLSLGLTNFNLLITGKLSIQQSVRIYVGGRYSGFSAYTYLAKEEYTEATRDFLVSTFFCFALNALLASEEVRVRTFSTF